MVSHFWIEKVYSMLKIDDDRLIQWRMENWKTERFVIPWVLSKLKNWYNLEKGHELINYLLFKHVSKLYSKTEMEMNNLVNKLKIFSNDIRMQFGIYNSSSLNLYWRQPTI